METMGVASATPSGGDDKGIGESSDIGGNWDVPIIPERLFMGRPNVSGLSCFVWWISGYIYG